MEGGTGRINWNDIVISNLIGKKSKKRPRLRNGKDGSQMILSNVPMTSWSNEIEAAMCSRVLHCRSIHS